MNGSCLQHPRDDYDGPKQPAPLFVSISFDPFRAAVGVTSTQLKALDQLCKLMLLLEFRYVGFHVAGAHFHMHNLMELMSLALIEFNRLFSLDFTWLTKGDKRKQLADLALFSCSIIRSVFTQLVSMDAMNWFLFFFFSQSVTDVRWGCQTLKKDVKWPRPSWKPLQWKKLSAILAHSQTSTDRRCHQIGPNYVHIRLRSNWNRIAARSWTNDLTDDPIIHLLLPGCQLVWVSSYQRKSQWNKPTAAVRACTRG